jgi:hypothetical protein
MKLKCIGLFRNVFNEMVGDTKAIGPPSAESDELNLKRLVSSFRICYLGIKSSR